VDYLVYARESHFHGCDTSAVVAQLQMLAEQSSGWWRWYKHAIDRMTAMDYAGDWNIPTNETIAWTDCSMHARQRRHPVIATEFMCSLFSLA